MCAPASPVGLKPGAAAGTRTGRPRGARVRWGGKSPGAQLRPREHSPAPANPRVELQGRRAALGRARPGLGARAAPVLVSPSARGFGARSPGDCTAPASPSPLGSAVRARATERSPGSLGPAPFAHHAPPLPPLRPAPTHSAPPRFPEAARSGATPRIHQATPKSCVQLGFWVPGSEFWVLGSKFMFAPTRLELGAGSASCASLSSLSKRCPFVCSQG